MLDPSGQRVIVYNGEIYNYRDFIAPLEARGHRFRSSSDTESLLYLYEEHGPAFVEKLRGMFAFALWDAPRRRLMLARDRLGIKPLYYFADGQHVAFASELKALLADPALPHDFDDRAWADFLHLMSISSPQAIFRGVRKVQPGHYVIVENGRVSEHRYWDVPMETERQQISLDGTAAEFDTRFQETVSAHMLSDVPVGAFLSGGIDSSAVVAMMAKSSPKKIDTFAITFPGQEEFDEGKYARMVADHIGVEHHEYALTPELMDDLPKIAWHADEPFAISSSIGLYALSRIASQHAKVVLTGDGGDEVFGGYVWRHAVTPQVEARSPLRREAERRLFRILARAMTRVPELRNLPEPVRRKLSPRMLERIFGKSYVRSCSVYQDEDLERLLTPERARAVRTAWDNNILEQSYSRYPQASEVARRLYTDIKTTLVGEMLTKVDRMTMAFGLEARVPFLDHRLVEWAFSLPDDVKVVPGEGKRLIRRSLKTKIPEEVLTRPKHGFNLPMREWLRGRPREMAAELLRAPQVESRGIFRPEEVQRILREHDEGVDRSNQIFVLLLTELWFREYVDGRQRFATA